MSGYSYRQVLDDLNSLLNAHEKMAADVPSSPGHIKDEDVLRGDRRATKGEGYDADDEGDDEALVEGSNPAKEDDGEKSVDYLLEDDQVEKGVEKASRKGDNLLLQIYNQLTKEGKKRKKHRKLAMEDDSEMDYDEEENDEEENDEEENDNKESEKKEEMPMSEEEKDELKKMSSVKRKKYMQEKRAGFEFAKMLHKNGTLEKIAAAVVGPHLEEIGSYEAGKVIAQLEKEGFALTNREHMEKAASYMAGQMISALEKEGLITINNNTKINEKTASGKYSKAEAREIIKQAAYTSTEAVLHDLAKRDIGKQLNHKLKAVQGRSNL